VHDFLAKGGMGSVYRGTRKADGLKIALKFFGYDEKCPDMDSIQLEVTALTALRGLDGVVSLIGSFPDTANGILGKKAYKIWPKSYPILVMPLLEGGALIDRIHTRTSVCENDLKHWFKQFIVGLGNIHSKGYIHRDLKLENIMLETMADDSRVRIFLLPSPLTILPSLLQVRIIDFGLVIKMTGEIFNSHKLSGTRGYHSPETLRWKQYSPKTDIWQAGVCLYSMLSGFLPFHPDNDAQTLEAKYFAMTGPAWLGISDRAKDLVSRILVADPEKRLSIQEILKHPWMTSEASQQDLGVEYVARIKHLALRQKMRGFFLQSDIGETNKLRRGHLAEILPFLKPSARTRLASYVSINSSSDPSKFKVGRSNSSSSLSYSEHGMSCYSSSSHGPNSPSKASMQERAVMEFKAKLHVFQELVIESFREKLQRANGGSSSSSAESPSKFTYTIGGSSSEQQQQRREEDLCLGYEEFVDLLTKAGLSHLAEKTVFSIFDMTNSGAPPPFFFPLLSLLLTLSFPKASLISRSSSSLWSPSSRRKTPRPASMTPPTWTCRPSACSSTSSTSTAPAPSSSTTSSSP
jgi:serine/threonine protein kinase